ncbi:stage II sporulation protein M [Nanoarchaeota archaeon]
MKKRGIKKHKQNFSFKQEYKESWKYLKNSKNYIYTIIGLFVVFALIGYFVPIPEVYAERILDFIRELLLKTEGMGQAELSAFILLNNIQSSFFGMLLGIFLGIFSIITTLVNGFILGFVSNLTVNYEGFGVLWKLFPHGIFELPAIFISLGLGLKLGSFIFQKERKKAFVNYLLNSIRAFLLIVIPLLVLAAIIEGFLIVILG